MKMAIVSAGVALMLQLCPLSSIKAQEPPQALAELMKFEGHWEGQATLTLNGATYTFTYHADFKKTASGAALFMNEWFSSPELGNLTGTNVIGYNGNDHKIHWFSCDNFGTTHDHTGVWIDSKHFHMETKEMMEKKPYVEKIDLTVNGNDEIGLVLQATLGGKPYESVRVTFKRMQTCTQDHSH